MSDKEYWRGYVAARLQNAATENALRQRAEQAEARVRALEGAQPLIDELARAEAKFPTYPTDVIHAATIVSEEAGELAQAALQATYEGGSMEAVRKEAIQTGAMALRLLLHFDNLVTRQSEQRARPALSAPGQPPCKQCGGSGKVHSHNDICWVCDGTGHAPGRPEGPCEATINSGAGVVKCGLSKGHTGRHEVRDAIERLMTERDEARTARAGREGGESQPLPPNPTCPECHGTGDAPNAQFRCPCRWRHLSKAGREGGE